MIGWAFMHEVNISPPLNLVRFFLNSATNLKRKIEKHNASLDIFVSDTSIARNVHLLGYEKKHFSYIKTHFWIRFWNLKQLFTFVIFEII